MLWDCRWKKLLLLLLCTLWNCTILDNLQWNFRSFSYHKPFVQFVAVDKPSTDIYILVLFIVDGNATCTTNLSSSGAVQENDVIVMTCSITYSGNWAPVMRWFNSVTRHNFTDDDITSTNINTTVTSQLTVTASANLNGSRLVCVTYFNEPKTSLPTTATNVPSYMYTWTSAIFNVQCK